MGQSSGVKPRERKCGTCRHYQQSPLWRKGWCRNSLLYDPQTNHLVEADTLACSRTFIDYWEARDGSRVAADGGPGPAPTQVRRAPSIPMTTTGPGGAPLRGAGNALTVAAVQAIPPARAPQLSLVRPEPEIVEAPTEANAPAALTVLALPLGESAPLPATPPIPHPATMPELEDDRHVIRNVLASGVLLAGLVAGFLLTRPHSTLPANGALTPVPSAVAALADLTPTAALPTPTHVAPTAVPTPGPLVLALGAKVQTTGLSGQALNVRQNPTTKAKIVGKFKDGATGVIKAGPQTADGVQWWQITGWDSGGTLGWVSAKYLKPVR